MAARSLLGISESPLVDGNNLIVAPAAPEQPLLPWTRKPAI
jgi:hypothetical protein